MEHHVQFLFHAELEAVDGMRSFCFDFSTGAGYKDSLSASFSLRLAAKVIKCTVYIISTMIAVKLVGKTSSAWV